MSMKLWGNHTSIKIILTVVLIFSLTGCQDAYSLYSDSYLGPFDTVIEYMSYCKSEDEFDEQFDYIKERLDYYDQLFDKYNECDLNNVYTINEYAGIKEVVVEPELFDLIQISIERYTTLSTKVNIAMGAITEIWKQYKDEAEDGVGDVPDEAELIEASRHIDLNNIVLNEEDYSIYLKDELMSIDVGAVAKGYALELIKQELLSQDIDNFLISGGGNIVSHGERKIEKEGNFYIDECANQFCVGIESPKDGNYADSELDYEAILVVLDSSVVTSGDYERYYYDDYGVRYCHLIDPDTLYPGTYFRSVSVICEDSGLADYLSTALFLMEYEEGLELVESMDEVEAIWLFEDGKIRNSSGLSDNENIYVINKERLE